MIVSVGQTGQMDPTYRLGRLEADGHRLIEVAIRDLSATVPACPDWDTRGLVAHICSVWQALRIQVEAGSMEPASRDDIQAPPDDDDALSTLAHESLARLGEALAAVDPATPVWTWSADQTMGFYQRRAHQETLVHRVDAEQALDDRTPVPAGDGVDGVDELFTLIAPRRDHALPSGSLHLHQTDGDGEFMLQVIDGRISVSHEHAKGDAALRAGGEDLLLTMWGRRNFDGLELFGDAQVAAQWAGLAS